MDSVIQQNASATEEMASTAEELSSQAMQLQDVISFFKLDDSGDTENDRQMDDSPYATRVRAPQPQEVIQEQPELLNYGVKTVKKLPGFKLDLDDQGRIEDNEFEKY